MNLFNRIFYRNEIKRCNILGVSTRFSRRMYNKQQIPSLYFTMDYVVNNTSFFYQGEKYPIYNWNYDRMITLIQSNIISENGST